MSDLINQPSAMPTRKLSAVAIAGALTAAVIAGIDAYWPGSGMAFSPVITAVTTTVVSVIAGYFTRNKG